LFKVKSLPSFERDFKKLPQIAQKKIDHEILSFSSNPYPKNSKKLVGQKAAYRIKVGDYRLIYEVDADQHIVYLLRTAHRKDIYRSL
jgi:mRNA interferase RelE/StbE